MNEFGNPPNKQAVNITVWQVMSQQSTVTKKVFC